MEVPTDRSGPIAVVIALLLFLLLLPTGAAALPTGVVDHRFQGGTLEIRGWNLTWNVSALDRWTTADSSIPLNYSLDFGPFHVRNGTWEIEYAVDGSEPRRRTLEQSGQGMKLREGFEEPVPNGSVNITLLVHRNITTFTAEGGGGIARLEEPSEVGGSHVVVTSSPEARPGDRIYVNITVTVRAAVEFRLDTENGSTTTVEELAPWHPFLTPVFTVENSRPDIDLRNDLDACVPGGTVDLEGRIRDRDGDSVNASIRIAGERWIPLEVVRTDAGAWLWTHTVDVGLGRVVLVELRALDAYGGVDTAEDLLRTCASPDVGGSQGDQDRSPVPMGGPTLGVLVLATVLTLRGRRRGG